MFKVKPKEKSPGEVREKGGFFINLRSGIEKLK